ncbi:MAG: C1 family peptidase [Acidimicrobiia bacterium]|nr:C1 family peptidase [Acidimicrobiia bacterium]
MALKSLAFEALDQALQETEAPWESGENSMTALTEDQRVIRLGLSPPTGEMSVESAAIAFEQGLTAAVPRADTIGAPAAVDLRSLNGKDYTTPVKNQGACGSCVAFGTVAVLETTYKRKANQPNSPIDLSEAHLFYCHGRSEGRNCSNGWWPEAALKKSQDIGVTFEKHYPYTGGDQDCTGLSSDWQSDLAKAVGYTKLTSPAAMKNWIATNGSITGCFVVYQDFFQYKSGVYRHVTGASRGGHCVEIIGYNDSLNAWICKNSWGPNWGNKGYFMIEYGQCSIETWLGPFGANNVTLKTWLRDAHVAGLWANTVDRNSWAYLSGTGWRKVSDASRTTHETMLTQLVSAKTMDSPVNALTQGNEIHEIYV